MPRYPVTEKTIHGQPVTQTVFLNSVCEAILAVEGGAKVGDIVSTLGPEWDTPAGRRTLGQTFQNLFSRGMLARVEGEPGVYMVNRNRYKRRGVTRFDEDEKNILRILRARGGFARFSEILEDMDLRPAGDAEDRLIAMSRSEYHRVVDVLKRSDRIRQDVVERGLGTGVYNLPWSELCALPIIGRWANVYLHYSIKQVGRLANNRRRAAGLEPVPITAHGWYDDQEVFFEQVGSAFTRLRELAGMSRDELMDVRPIRAAVAEFYRASDTPHGHVKVIRSEWREHMEAEVERMRKNAEAWDMPAGERQTKLMREVEAYRTEQEMVWEVKRGSWLYRDFEAGVVRAHVFAPLALYNAVAEFFEVCPAMLSRGVIHLQPTPEKLRPDNYRRTMDEIIEAELAADAVDAQRERLLAMSVDELAEEHASEN